MFIELPAIIAEALSAAQQQDSDGIHYSMPPDFYTDYSVAAAERENVFHTGWICVGREDEVPATGDYFVTQILNESLIVTRDKSKTVRVLSNVCRHRSALLLDGCGSTKRIVCPYHNWSYGLDGGLKRANLIDDQVGFDKTTCSLPSFNTEIWMGWIFVNLSGDASPLNQTIASLNPHVANYHPEEMLTVKASPEWWPINWKCLAENFMEGYHLTPVHLNTLHPMTPTKMAEKIAGDSAWTAYKSHYSPDFYGRPPFHPDMTTEEQRMSMMVWIYPGFVAAISPNSAVYMSLTPTSVCEVQTRWGVIARQSLHETGDAMERYEFAARFNEEDKARLVDVQRGLHSRFAAAGPLAPPDYEGCSSDFYNYMASRLLQR